LTSLHGDVSGVLKIFPPLVCSMRSQKAFGAYLLFIDVFGTDAKRPEAVGFLEHRFSLRLGLHPFTISLSAIPLSFFSADCRICAALFLRPLNSSNFSLLKRWSPSARDDGPLVLQFKVSIVFTETIPASRGFFWSCFWICTEPLLRIAFLGGGVRYYFDSFGLCTFFFCDIAP